MIEKLEPFDDEEFRWIDETGCCHPSKSSYLQSEILHFCECGNPDEVMIYVRDFLQKLDDQKWGDYDDKPYMFLCYWANSENLTEHGSTIRCSWLTNRGKELLNDINWCLENEKDD